MSETKRGIINNLNEKGFGFIRQTEGAEQKDIFFHASGLIDVKFDTLERGMKVCYVEKEGKKGPIAADIVIDYFEHADKSLDIKVKKNLRQKIK